MSTRARDRIAGERVTAGEDSPDAPENLTRVNAPNPREHEATWLGALPYALVVAGAALRIVPHPPNFAPIDAIALFGGAILPWPLGIAVPLAATVLSDAVLGFYPGFAWVYGSFVLIALIGLTLKRRRTAVRVAAAAVASSVVFFAVTNLGEWFGPLYPHTLVGLGRDYLAAVPFYRNTLVSDLGYSLALFGVYESVRRLTHRRSGVPRAISGRTA